MHAVCLQGLTLLGAHSHMPMQPSPPLMHALWCRLAETCTAPTFHARRLAGSLRCMALLAGGSMASPPHALQAEAGLTAVHGTLLVMRVKGQDTPSAKHLTDLASLTAGVHGRMPSGHVPSGHATSANGRQVQQQLARHALRLQVAAVLQRRRNQRRAANNYTGTINCGVSHAHSQQQRPGRDPAAARERSALRQLQALYLLLRQGAAGLQAGTGPVGTAAAGDATAAPGRSGSSVQLGAGGGAGCGAQAGGGGGGGGRSLEAAAAVGELLVEKVYGLAALQLLR